MNEYSLYAVAVYGSDGKVIQPDKDFSAAAFVIARDEDEAKKQVYDNMEYYGFEDETAIVPGFTDVHKVKFKLEEIPERARGSLADILTRDDNE